MKVEEDGEDSATHGEIQELMKKDGRNHGGDEGFDEGMEWNDEDGGLGMVEYEREERIFVPRSFKNVLEFSIFGFPLT